MLANRGGIPRISQITVDAVNGQFFQFEALSLYVRLKASAAGLRIFATPTDFAANTNFYELAASEVFEMPLEDRGLFLKAAAGSISVQIVVLHRKG